MVLMAARRKRKWARENLNLVSIRIWIEGIISLLDWEKEKGLFSTQLKNGGSTDLAAPDKNARWILL